MGFIKFITAFLFLFAIVGSFANTKLETKLDKTLVRFISKDKKYTYYQKSTGALFLSTNYSVKKVIQGESGSQFGVNSFIDTDKLIVTQVNNFNSILNPTKISSFYIINRTTGEVLLKKEGLRPRLHQNGTWLSFFDRANKKIHFENTVNKKNNFTILLDKETPNFFIPKVVYNNGSFFYVAYLKKLQVLYKRSIKNSSLAIIYQAESSKYIFDICSLAGKRLVLFQSALSRGIRKMLLLKESPKKYEFMTLYRNISSDIGNILCSENNVFFVKEVGGGSELAEINVTNLKVSILSKLNFVQNIIQMDGKILIPLRGEFYLPDFNIASEK